MLILDCENFDSAMGSLSSAAGVTDTAVRAVLRASDAYRDDWDYRAGPWEKMVPRMLVAELGIAIEDVKFDAAYYFHGTRVFRPHAFLESGILPLGAILNSIWDDLYSLTGEEIALAIWGGLRQKLDGGAATSLDSHVLSLYRMKTAAPFHHGPFGFLVREQSSSSMNHDYLQIPEIVEDISRCLGLGLQQNFEDRAKSCIVKFVHTEVNTDVVESALLYVLAKVHHRELDIHSARAVKCEGAVPAADVIYVEEFANAFRRRQRPGKPYRHQISGCG